MLLRACHPESMCKQQSEYHDMPSYVRRSKVVITASGVWRGPKTLVLKTIVDDGIKLSEKAGHKVRFDPHKLDLRSYDCVICDSWATSVCSDRVGAAQTQSQTQHTSAVRSPTAAAWLYMHACRRPMLPINLAAQHMGQPVVGNVTAANLTAFAPIAGEAGAVLREDGGAGEGVPLDARP